MRKLLWKLGIVKLVWFKSRSKTKLRIVWYGRDGRYVKIHLGNNELFNPKVWFELLPEGKLRYRGAHSTADYTWEVYKPGLRLSPFSFLKRNRALEVKLRLE